LSDVVNTFYDVSRTLLSVTYLFTFRVLRFTNTLSQTVTKIRDKSEWI